MANLREEKKLWRKGYKRVVGLDEAGRGPLAGPVAAAAVIVNSKTELPFVEVKVKKKMKSSSPLQLETKNLLKEIKDSKKLTSQKREEFYKILTNHSQIKWGMGRVSEKVIDKINILEGTKLAMKRAVKSLEKKLKRKINFLILDGKMKLDLAISQKSIIKADEKVFSCTAASIIGKVKRDRIMKKYHQRYPQYRFDRHKGYPTKYHKKMLKKYGPCKIHRKSFAPVKKYSTIK